MRKGFFGTEEPSRPSLAAQEVPPPATDPAALSPAPALGPAPETGSGRRPTAQPPDTTTAEWQANFTQCLQLLRGPTDEKRFVGLLLVTRLLPDGSEEAIRQVLEALGLEFLDRLLLPITRDSASPPVNEEEYDKRLTSCSLGLSMLASACRLEEVAAGEWLSNKVPALIKVIHARGLGNLIQAAPQAPSSGPPADQPSAQRDVAEESASVADCLECLLSVASSGGSQAARTLHGAGTLETVTGLLSDSLSVRVPTSPPQGGKQKNGAKPSAVQVNLSLLLPLPAALMVVRLVAHLLAGGSGGRAAMMTEYEDSLVQLLPSMGLLLGLSDALAVIQEEYEDTLVQLLPSMGLLLGLSDVLAATQKGGAVQGEVMDEDPGEAASRAADAAMVQLEALHTMLLLMPIPEELDLHKQLQSPAKLKTPKLRHWADAVRLGLGWIMQSRVSGVQKHSAIQLAAAMVALLGPSWQMNPHAPGEGESTDAAASFIQVLTETLHVETSLLLHDALFPDQSVSQVAGRMDTRGQWKAPQPSESFLQALQIDSDVEDGDAEGGDVEVGDEEEDASSLSKMITAEEAVARAPTTSMDTSTASASCVIEDLSDLDPASCIIEDLSDPDPTPAASSPLSPEQPLPSRPPPSGPGPAPPAPVLVMGATPTTAGQRAAQLLPACFALLESASSTWDVSEVDGDEDGCPRPPTMGLVVAQQLIRTLEQTVGSMVQFLSVLQQQWQEHAPASNAVDTDGARDLQLGAALGAVRVLGRYLVDAPDTHTEDFRAALPFMLGLRLLNDKEIDDGRMSQALCGIHFLTPGLLMLLDYKESGDGRMSQALCGIHFLTPGLLMVE
eukprot:gene7486-631_t